MRYDITKLLQSLWKVNIDVHLREGDTSGFMVWVIIKSCSTKHFIFSDSIQMKIQNNFINVQGEIQLWGLYKWAELDFVCTDWWSLMAVRKKEESAIFSGAVWLYQRQ